MRFLAALTGCAAAVLAFGPAGTHAADATAGRSKAQMCSVCHGLDGLGRNPDVPNLAGESSIYIARQLEAYKEGERHHEQMSIVAQSLSEDDIANLAAWYSSLKVTVEMPQ